MKGEQKPKYKPNPLARKYNHSQVAKPKKTSVNQLKKQLRDTTRSLQRTKNAQIKVDLERRLESLNVEIALMERQKKEDALKEQYQYIKFVESKKTTRKLKQVEKKLAVEPTQELEEEKRKLELYKKYTAFYPVDCKYVALYPKSAETPEEAEAQTEAEKGDSKTDAFRNQVLEKIKEFDENGDLVDGFVFRMRETSSAESEVEKKEDDFFI